MNAYIGPSSCSVLLEEEAHVYYVRHTVEASEFDSLADVVCETVSTGCADFHSFRNYK